MHNAIRKHHISFKNAFSGLKWALSSQPNFRVHLACAAIAIVTGLYVGLNQIEWVVIVLTIVLSLSGEMINTSIEAVTDLVTSEWKTEAKIAKDVSAGMMLTIALGALTVAAVLLLPKLILKLYP